jgi:hypothetical protein
MIFLDLSASFTAIHLGHGDVDYRDIRVTTICQFYRFFTIAGFANHFKVKLLLQNLAGSLPDDSMVISYENFNLAQGSTPLTFTALSYTL